MGDRFPTTAHIGLAPVAVANYKGAILPIWRSPPRPPARRGLTITTAAQTRVLLLGGHPAIEDIRIYLANNLLDVFVVNNLDGLSLDSTQNVSCVLLHLGEGHNAMTECIQDYLAKKLEVPTILLHSGNSEAPATAWPFVASYSLDRLDMDRLHSDIEMLCKMEKRLRATASAHKSTGNTPSETLTQGKISVQTQRNFLTMVSHDIRTPMSGIIGMADLALTKTDSPAVRRHIETIKQSAQSLLSTLNDIVDLSHSEAGNLKLDNRPLQLRETLAPSMEVIANLCREKGLAFSCRFDPHIPEYLEGDPGRLIQIFNNLLMNAVTFTQQGEISVKAEAMDTQGQSAANGMVRVRFCVQDTGIGLSKEFQGQFLAGLSPEHDCQIIPNTGASLTLGLVHNLVQLMGGSLDLESQKNVGSIFRITLPFTRASVPRARQKKATQLDSPDSGPEALSVLLVEDNKVNQLFTREMLLAEGHSVIVAENGQEAVDILARQRFDIVLMDIQMPVMDGVEATRTIRDPSSAVLDHDVPIIALTAHAIKGDRERFIQAGMTDYLTKPVDFRKLFGIMTTLFPSKKIVAGSPPPPVTVSSTQEQNGPAIDLEWFGKMLSSRKDFLRRMFEVFVREEPLRLEKTKKALEAGDMEILRFLAHSIKGATATMGAYGARDHAAALEKAAKAADPQEASCQYARLAEEMGRVLEFMQGFLD